MVSYGDTSTPNRSNRDNSYTDINPGPYIAIVKDNVDVTKMGGLKVLIPSLSGTDEGPASMLYDVKYLMPFYGAKSPNATAKTSPYDFNDSPHSYGMWMVPPDIDSKVMVTFVEGKVSQGYWFGCVQDPYTNHMIPGIAASTDTALGSEEGESTRGVAQKYGTNRVPVSEVNRTTWASASAAGIDKLKKPIHPFADTLQSQGLIEDTVRGTTTSSARRESPSAVFGISTPGRINEAEKKFRLGPTDAKKEGSATRGTGHTFVMDDGDAAGDNQLIRLRTGSGHQLLMHDTKGVVYLANGSGNVWMEFSDDGSIDIYAGGGINIRSKGDMNFHSEKDINMYANNNFKIKANQSVGKVSIDGADVTTYASKDIVQFAEFGTYAVRSGLSIRTQAGGVQIHQAQGQVHLVGQEVHFNSIGVNQFLVQPPKRSAMGTEEISVPDIKLNTVKGANDRDIIVTTPEGRIYVETTIPGMTGMTVPTHEPYDKHRDKKK
jgi:hypothetical protein